MIMMSINIRSVVEFKVCVSKEGDQYAAFVDKLALKACGSTVEEAGEFLVESFRDWAYQRVSEGNLEETLVSIGYPDIGEDTEVHLVMTLEDE